MSGPVIGKRVVYAPESFPARQDSRPAICVEIGPHEAISWHWSLTADGTCEVVGYTIFPRRDWQN